MAIGWANKVVGTDINLFVLFIYKPYGHSLYHCVSIIVFLSKEMLVDHIST